MNNENKWLNRTYYNYEAKCKVKEIVISVQELRCRVNIEPEYGARGQKNHLEYVKQSAKHKLLDMIGDFILVKEVEDRSYVEAELFLPYVKDDKIKQLESLIYRLEMSERSKADAVTRLMREAILLKRPWWKKLLRMEK